jgi:tryptophan synthase beta chain
LGCWHDRAKRLEKLLGTPAKIYYKYEGTSPAGSHKANTAVPQAFYNAAAGVKNVVTETGAGQWGSALSFASTLFGLNCEVNLNFLPSDSPLSLLNFLQCTITNS